MRNNDTISVTAKYQQIEQWITEKINVEPDINILGISVDEMAEYYFSNNHFTTIEIDRERTDEIEIIKEKKIIPAHQREPAFRGMGDKLYEFEFIVLKIPVIPHKNLDIIKNLESSFLSLSNLSGELFWEPNMVSIKIPIKGYGFSKTDEQVLKEVFENKEWFQTWSNHLKAILEEKNNTLLTNIKNLLERRKRQIQEDNDRHSKLLKLINIPVRKKEDEAIVRYN
jgi:hypothetical protein